MIGFLWRMFAERQAERQADRDYQLALDHLHSPELFTDVQRATLSEWFPKAWTHLDNFSQDEIFSLAATLALFGFPCDTPEKMKLAMDILQVQSIYRTYPGNPNIIKRA